jgi:hypothetical protein
MDKPHKPSQVAVAKLEEIVWHCRPMESGGMASENVNECSFMVRIVRILFVGRVLCHMIEPNAVSYNETFDCKVFIPPMDEHFETIKAIEPKNWDEK